MRRIGALESMPRIARIFVDEDLLEGECVMASESATRHLTRVLRLKEGSVVSVFDGRGHEHSARIESCGSKRAALRVGSDVHPVPESPARITLLQGISRGERMDFVVQKTTELGVVGIRPVFTERSVVKLDEKRSRRRLEHWRSVAISACEQSGRATLPEILTPIPLEPALLTIETGGLRILLDPCGESILPSGPLPAGGVTLLIGPEGGLSGAERQLARSLGFTSLAIGPRILRTETAAVAAVTLIQSIWGDLSASGAPSR